MDSSRQQVEISSERLQRRSDQDHSRAQEAREDAVTIQSAMMSKHFAPASLIIAPPVDISDKLPLSLRVAHSLVPVLLLVILAVHNLS